MARLVEEMRVRVIHTHTAAAHSLGLLVKRRCPSVKLVVSRRVDFHIKQNYLSKRKYYSEKNDLFLCVSDKVKEILYEDGIPAEKLLTVRSGVDLNRFVSLPDSKYLREEFRIKDNTVLIGNVAALVDHKDQATLLRAVAKIKTEVPFLFIVGAGELEKALKQTAKELGIEDRVLFTGYREDVLAFFALFDVFTLTSKEEGLGTSVLDAMASHLPVIATRGGGISEMLIHDKGGFLSNVGDDETLAEQYRALIENQELRERFGKFNRNFVKEFSVEETIKKTKNIYDILLNHE